VAIAIKRGSSTTSLFLTHEGSGLTLYAHEIAPYLDSRINVYALPPDQNPAAAGVETLASRMVETLRRIQPEGPYNVAGWSFGGLIAYEIAKQLLGAGHHLNFVGLLDTNYPNGLPAPYRSQPTDFDNKQQLATYLEPLTAPHRKLLDYYKSERDMTFESMVQQCQRMELMPAHFREVSPSHIHKWLFRSHIYAQASAQYVVTELPLTIDLFVTDHGPAIQRTLGWETVLSAEHLRITDIGGTHHSMLQPPHVASLGAAMSRFTLTFKE